MGWITTILKLPGFVRSKLPYRKTLVISFWFSCDIRFHLSTFQYVHITMKLLQNNIKNLKTLLKTCGEHVSKTKRMIHTNLITFEDPWLDRNTMLWSFYLVLATLQRSYPFKASNQIDAHCFTRKETTELIEPPKRKI